MSEDLRNKKVNLLISDPFELGEQLGWPALDAVVLKVQKNEESEVTAVLLKLTSPFSYKNTHCQYFYASTRLVGASLGQLLNSQSVFCSFTRIPPEQLTSEDPFDVSWWRGGVAIIGNIEPH